MLFAIIGFLSNCTDDDSAGKTFITQYPKYEIQGDNPTIVTVGEPYKDDGVIAILDGKDVASSVAVNSNVDYKTMGMYTVEYSYVNKDGFRSSTVRDVIVCNPHITIDLSGKYTGQEGTKRKNLSTGAEVVFPGFHTTITLAAPAFFKVNDFFAGYYAENVYPNYGYSVMGMSGYMALNEDNTISLVSSHISAWGDSLIALKNGKYDPATGEISWDAYYSSFMFHVILKK